MTESALCRMPLRILGSLQFGNWALERSDRGGQDKNRKVRAVGSLRNSLKFRLSAHIANVSRTLPFSTTRYRTKSSDTLRRNR
jgi:hypothetical protein